MCILVQVIPATSLTLPLLGRYLLFSMVLVAVSVCLATIVLNLHYRWEEERQEEEQREKK